LGTADEIGSGAWGYGADGGDFGTSAVAGFAGADAGAEVGGMGLPRMAGCNAEATGLSERGADGRGEASSRLRQGLRVGPESAGKFWLGVRS